MMKNVWKIFNLIILISLIIICFLGTFYKHISFGLGLGDMIGYAFLYFITIIHLILSLVFRKKGNSLHAALSIVFFLLTIYICLEATIWRGSEYRWNGNIFYESSGN